MTRKLLIETILPDETFSPVRLVESADGSKKVRLEGVAIQGDVKNHNGRNYPKSEIERAVKEMNDRIKKFGPVPGECDHPDTLTINYERASHLITEMWMDGSNGNAKFDVVPVGLGEIIAGFIKAGARPGVSSRGTGNVGSKGDVSDFDIVTIDVVATPSAPNAYPKPILESLQGTKQGRDLVSVADALKHDPRAQKFMKREIERFIRQVIER